MTYKRYTDENGLLTVAKDGQPFAVLEEPDAPIIYHVVHQLFTFRGKEICWEHRSDVKWWKGCLVLQERISEHRINKLRFRPWLTSRKDISPAPPRRGSTSAGKPVNSGSDIDKRKKRSSGGITTRRVTEDGHWHDY